MGIRYRVYVISIVFTILLLTPLIHLVRYQVIEADEFLSKPNALRTEQTLELRGSLLERNFKPLAYSQGRVRIYPLGDAAGSLIGSSGSDGLDSYYSQQTQPLSVPRTPWGAVSQITKGDLRGDDVVLTLDARLQKSIYDMLSGYLGAVVVMDAQSGELLALVSRPSYDNNRVSDPNYWQNLVNSTESSPLMERCLSRRYSPGSTFKALVMAGALEDGLTKPNEEFFCSGSMDVGNFELKCNGVHGSVTLTQALAYSCNMAFATIGKRLKVSGIDRWARRFGFVDELPDVPGAETAQLASNKAPSSAAEAAIGQADLFVSPLHMARIASVIANEGYLVEPHLFKGVARSGNWQNQISISPGKQIISTETAASVREAMCNTVEYGTCTAAALPGVQVAGKSGSAENPDGAAHAWFIGFAPADNPRIVCAVILENAGGGGRYAAPIARDVFAEALQIMPSNNATER